MKRDKKSGIVSWNFSTELGYSFRATIPSCSWWSVHLPYLLLTLESSNRYVCQKQMKCTISPFYLSSMLFLRVSTVFTILYVFKENVLLKEVHVLRLLKELSKILTHSLSLTTV